MLDILYATCFFRNFMINDCPVCPAHLSFIPIFLIKLMIIVDLGFDLS